MRISPSIRMQIIAPLGCVVWGLEVLPFPGRFGAAQGLKQERGESRNKVLGLVEIFFFFIAAFKTQSSSLLCQAVQLILIYCCKRCERKIGSKIIFTAEMVPVSVSQSEYLIKNSQTSLHSVFLLVS